MTQLNSHRDSRSAHGPHGAEPSTELRIAVAGTAPQFGVPLYRGPLFPAAAAGQAAKRPVFGKGDLACFLALSAASLAAICYLLSRWVAMEDWKREPLSFLGLAALVLVPVAMHQCRWFVLPWMSRPAPVSIGHRWKVGVATTFVPGAEPLEMLERTIQSLVSLDYPHDTWVLDEGDDARVEELCRKHGAFHFSRKDRPEFQAASGPFKRRTKYGNYNAWLSQMGCGRYEIVAAFDPDHAPQPEFLDHVLGHFEDPRIGYVQAAQAYGNQDQSWIARGAAEDTYDYFSTIQMVSFSAGYPVIVGGHNVHRTAALRDIGGFGAHDADDILTTLHYRFAGWQGVYVPKILARGLTPVDWHSYLTQQRRWLRSVMDLKVRSLRGQSGAAPLVSRAMSFAHGFGYVCQGLLPGAALATLGVWCAAGSEMQALSAAGILPLVLLAVALGAASLHRQRYFLDRRRESGLHWRSAALRWARWPQTMLAAGDVLLNRGLEYTITEKSPSGRRRSAWLWPHVIAAAALAACWTYGTVQGNSTPLLVHVLTAAVLAGTIAMVMSARVERRRPRPAANAESNAAFWPFRPQQAPEGRAFIR